MPASEHNHVLSARVFAKRTVLSKADEPLESPGMTRIRSEAGKTPLPT